MPSITIWDRIEPRCRVNEATPGLEARVHDPLWLLARQWQVGEFEGRDAGSPVVATVQSSVAALDRFAVAGQPEQPYDGAHPLETLVEREMARPGAGVVDLRQASEAGLYFVRLLHAANLPPSMSQAYLHQYPLTAADPVLSGRVIDGVGLHSDLAAAGDNLPTNPAIPAPQKQAVLNITRAWMKWYSSLFDEPVGAGAAWSADRLEYRFSMAEAGGSGSYVAQEYDGGSIDWHTLTAPQSNSAVARHSRRPRSRLSSPRRLHFVGCRHVAFGNSNRAEQTLRSFRPRRKISDACSCANSP